MTPAKRHAITAGAGVGGLVAALALARAGLRVTVLERAALLEETGAGIQLPPNALRALDTLGLGETLRARADKSEGLRVREARSGRHLMSLSSAAMQARWGAPSLVMHRADLLRLLVEAIALHPGINLTTGAALAGFSNGADGVVVALKRGLLRQQISGDLLIGADGLRSTVRGRLLEDKLDGPQPIGAVAWRALIEAQRLPAEARSGETDLWLAPNLHVVTYPLRGGRLINVVAVLRAAGAPVAAPNDEWNQPGDPAAIAAAFARTAPPLRQLIAAAEGWRVWPLHESAPLQHWSQGRVALLGDAAHAMAPFLAQGAAQAIEDAIALGRALQANGDTAAALLAYDRARSGRAAEVARQSRKQGAIYHLAGPAAFVRNLVMRHSGEARLLKRLDWLYAAPA